MREEIIRVHTLDNLNKQYSEKWGCALENIAIEVLSKPGLLSRNYKVKVSEKEIVRAQEEDEGTIVGEIKAVPLENGRMLLIPHNHLQTIIPYPEAGTLYVDGEIETTPHNVSSKSQIEFEFCVKPGERSWSIQILENGLKAIAQVRHERAVVYAFMPSFSCGKELSLKEMITEEHPEPMGQYKNHSQWEQDLKQAGIVFGIKPNLWEEIEALEGWKEILVAEGTLPLPGKNAQIKNLTGMISQAAYENLEKIDYKASRLKTIENESVLARKIPAVTGIPGRTVLGAELPAPPVKDIQFKLKTNVTLSEDGLAVIATCAGMLIHPDEVSYGVEKVYATTNVNLESGSIEFPDNVKVSGDVFEGFYVRSKGMVEIRGSVSGAEIIAEKGLTVFRNVVDSDILVGKTFVVRSQLIQKTQRIVQELDKLIKTYEQLLQVEETNPVLHRQGLKVLIEQRFSDLPKYATDTEKFVLANKDEFITPVFIQMIQLVKKFTGGLGPVDPEAFSVLKKVYQGLSPIVKDLSLETPTQLECTLEYTQNSIVKCGGDFICHKGVYNSTIQAGGKLTIEGFCRGGDISAHGDVYVKELGGKGMSKTSVHINSNAKLKANFCFANVTIFVDKQVVSVDENCKDLVIYKENGRVQVEKLKAD